jgi:hypothetical protein
MAKARNGRVAERPREEYLPIHSLNAIHL